MKNLKFGACAGPDDAQAFLEAGFDYVELPAVALNAETGAPPHPAFEQLKPAATNLFFPGSIRLFGPERTRYLDYADRLFQRAREAQVRVMVVGSGGSRRAPEGLDPLACEKEFAEIVGELQGHAGRHGIKLAPESLNRGETNVGTDLGRLARLLAQVGVSYTADSYHLLYEWEADGNQGSPTEEWYREQLPTTPAHVHLADRPRNAPRSDDPALLGFVRRLKELGYDARVSLECRWNGESGEREAALERLKSLFS